MNKYNEPLCVDLDGTLVKTDMLWECFVRNLRSILAFLMMPIWLIKGRNVLKYELAKRKMPLVEYLPYNEKLLDYLHSEKSKGRSLLLVTASNIIPAKAVSEHLGIFDAVIASDLKRNLKGPEKLKAIRDEIGMEEFDYAGDSRSDLYIWKVARKAIVVNAPDSVINKLPNGADALIINDRTNSLLSLLRALRPHQWSKNLLVFLPVVTAGALNVANDIFVVFLTFLSFCAVASGTYIINDILDLDADRQHPRKSNRPFAHGDISIQFGFISSLIIVLIGFELAILTGTILFVGIYCVTTLCYSIWLKKFPLADVFCLAMLYTFRIIAGSLAIERVPTPWLLGFSVFIFLSLAFIKRVAEIQHSKSATDSKKIRGYKAQDSFALMIMGISSGFASCLTLALFIQSESAKIQYLTPELLWALVPLVTFWICRMWLSTSRNYMHDDPIVYAAKDWVSWVNIGLVILLVIVARFLEIPIFSL
jgi:4-hydroxybenzoate polyprenyltransferase/phosphoserine phosphatase